jgi:uncharacterized protein YggE
MANPGEPGASKGGRFTFTYVAKIPEADRTKALAEAFAKAQSAAAETAHSAGMDLATVASLSSALSQEGDGPADPESVYMDFMLDRLQRSTTHGPLTEVTGAGPTVLAVQVSVTASYYLK